MPWLRNDVQDAQDVNVPRTNPLHEDKQSQQGSVTIDNIPCNSTQNVNPLSEEDIKKLELESTNTVIPCENPVLVRIDESQKVRIASTEEHQQDTSTILLHVAEVKEKESNEQTTYQSVTLEHKGKLNQAQSSV